jgi:uroporphyrin-III C-methyltransferase/precorrin-2 dehydrogenase/sirohydrochlorin ferrochelatase
MRGTVVLLMAVDNAPAIAAALVDGGRPTDTPVAVIVDGTMPTERTVLSTLALLAEDLATHRVVPPAIIVIGEVVAVARPAHYGRA